MSEPINTALPERHALDARIADLTREVERLKRANGQLYDDAMRLKDDACKATDEMLEAVEVHAKLQKRVRELGAHLRDQAADGHRDAKPLLVDFADLFEAAND